MDLFELFWELFINLCEKGLFLFFLIKHLSVKSARLTVINFSILIIIETIINYFISNSSVTVFLFPIINIIFVSITFITSLTQKFFYGLVASVIASFANELTFFIVGHFSTLNLETALIPSNTRMVLQLIYLLISAAAFYLLASIKPQNMYVPLYINIVVFMLLSLGIVALDNTLELTINNSNNSSFSASFVGLSILIILITISILFEYLGRTSYIKNKLEFENRQYELEKSNIHDIEETLINIRSLKHDYKQHIETIYSLAQNNKNEEVVKYCQELSGSSSLNNIVSSSNISIDALLSNKLMTAQNKKINVTHEIFLPNNTRIRPIDLCIIIGNLFDNAIESCEKLPENCRNISLTVKPKKELLYIEIINSTNDTYNIINDKLFSTKIEEGHGIGIRRVEELVKKYDGFTSYKIEKHNFTYSLVIPITTH